MWIGHRKKIRKLTFGALALRRSESLQTSVFESSLQWPIQIINPVNNNNNFI